MTGNSWSQVYLAIPLIGVFVHNGDLYTISADGYVHKVTSSGSVSTFATPAQSGIGGASPPGGIRSIGGSLYVSVGDDPIFAVWHDGLSWHVQASDDIHYPVQVIYDPAISPRYAYGRYTGMGGGIVIIDTLLSMSASAIASVNPVWLTAHDGRLYAMTATGIKMMMSVSYPEVWIDILARGPWYGYTAPRAMYFDDFGYVVILTGDDVFISKDNMTSFESYGYGGGVITDVARFNGSDILAKTTGITYWARWICSGSGSVGGAIIDGADMATLAYTEQVSLLWSHVRGVCKITDDRPHASLLKCSKFEATKKPTRISGPASGYLDINSCEFFSGADTMLEILTPRVRLTDCTIAANAIGLILNAVPEEISRCIIACNAIDIV